ncbi:MAG: ABC transporter ATP-binding protein [Armatimonadetes bacterium]|nr:ABC transporter ATP-binding protein [Armatimonadota bacterium]
MLRLQEINVYYSAIHALKNLSLEVEAGEIVTLIGANGAGKSTALKAISGLVRPKTGLIEYQGQNITRLSPEAIVRTGISHVPEGRRVFSNLTVRENLQLGAFTVKDQGQVASSIERVLTTFPRLKERLGQYGGTLSGGEQQMLAIGRALMVRPKLLILDEPSLGLAPFLVSEIFNIIRLINSEGTSILLVEQNAHLALGVAQRGYVMETGRVVLASSSDKLLNNEEVRKAYLGE